MRFRNTIIVLVLLVIVGGYALIVGLGSRPEERTKLLGISGDDIAKIDLQYPDREIVLERSKGGIWQLSKPIGGDADQFQANNLARAIADCEVTGTVEENPADLEPFGLAKPRTVVTVNTFDKKPHPSIDVGKATPVGFNAYIKTSDKPAVLLTSSSFPSGMNKTVNDLRDRDLMSFKIDDVQKFTLARDSDPPVEIVRDGDKWKIVKPAPYPADDTQVREALGTMVNAKASDFPNDKPGSVTQYGLEKPHITASVTLKNGETQSLLFGFKQPEEGKGGIYARRGERAPVYVVPAYVMSGLNKSALDFRDRTILSFDPSAIDSIKIKLSSGEFTLKRGESGKWVVIDNGKTSDGDVPVIERLLSQLHSLKGNSIVADPMPSAEPFGLSNPPIDITLVGKDGKEIGEVKLAKIEVKPTTPSMPGEPAKPRPEYYASSSANKAVYSLGDFSFAQLNKLAEMYRAKAAPTQSSTAPK
jgi:hypothetical protein